MDTISTSHIRAPKDGVKNLMDFIDQKINEQGHYRIRFTDEAQMNELAVLIGVPQCEHGRQFVANVLKNDDDPDASEVILGRTAAAQ